MLVLRVLDAHCPPPGVTNNIYFQTHNKHVTKIANRCTAGRTSQLRHFDHVRGEATPQAGATRAAPVIKSQSMKRGPPR